MSTRLCRELDPEQIKDMPKSELFEHIADCLGDELQRFAARRCRHQDDGEEVYQDALLSAHKYIDGFRGDARLKSWLMKLVVSACARRRRGLEAKSVSVSFDERSDSALQSAQQTDPETQAHLQQLLHHLQRELSELPDLERRLFWAAELQQRPLQDIAHEQGLTVSAVKSRLYRIRRQLKENVPTFFATSQ